MNHLQLVFSVFSGILNTLSKYCDLTNSGTFSFAISSPTMSTCIHHVVTRLVSPFTNSQKQVYEKAFCVSVFITAVKMKTVLVMENLLSTNKTSQTITASFVSNYRFDVHKNDSPIVIFSFIFVKKYSKTS